MFSARDGKNPGEKLFGGNGAAAGTAAGYKNHILSYQLSQKKQTVYNRRMSTAALDINR